MKLPDSIVFHLEGKGERPVELIDLEFGSDVIFSCASSEYQSARTRVGGRESVSVTKEWDMRRTRLNSARSNSMVALACRRRPGARVPFTQARGGL